MPNRPAVVVLDFETYYDNEYSLSKMTTQEYIHDPRFETIGVGVHVNGKSRWAAGLDVDRLLHEVQDNYPSCILVCHNAMFDYSIITTRYPYFKPSLVACTLSMARSLGMDFSAGGSLAKLANYLQQQGVAVPDKGTELVNALGKRLPDFTPQALSAYAEYCLTDVEICKLAFYEMVKLLPREELLWQDRVIRMHAEPTLVLNVDTLTQDLERVKSRKEQILTEVANVLGESDIAGLLKRLRSNEQFADLLRSFGVEPPTKVSPTTGKTTYALAKKDEGLLALQEHPDPRVQAIVEARLGTKSSIEETRLEKFINLSKLPRFSIPLTVSGAHTHRLGGCLTEDTIITVKGPAGDIKQVPIVFVGNDDLVWDGKEFVEHDGVVYAGEQEVITHDGITGTPDHRVYVTLRDARTLAWVKENDFPIVKEDDL